MDGHTWKVLCHNEYDYKLVNSGGQAVFNARLTCSVDGVIPYGNEVEKELRPGRCMRFRLINAKNFDSNLVNVRWEDGEGKTQTVPLNELTRKAVAPH